jgi:hypothetical protein
MRIDCRCDDVPVCQCLPDPKGRVRMCGYADMPICRCADVPMWSDTRARIFIVCAHCSRFNYNSLKRPDKSVNPLNPGSNRRCGCVPIAIGMRMCQCLPDPKGRVRICRCTDMRMPARPEGAGADVRYVPIAIGMPMNIYGK